MIKIVETSKLTISTEILVLAIATVWAMAPSPQGRRLWLSIMAIGLLAGLLFMRQPYWSPSSLLQSIANASLHDVDNA